MKHLAACDFEDLLQVCSPHVLFPPLNLYLSYQCTIPTFEGVFGNPEHDKIVIDLLFDLAVWHAYAKLQLHTNDTLKFFDTVTIALGISVRKFQDKVCPCYMTNELPQEHAACGRHQAHQAAQAPNQERGPSDNISQWKQKYLNLHTYKYHALADYPNTIQKMGTTDNYNMQII
ncbi:hypothetical protein BKA83DRAFT_4053833 [Pisolithus microcarpus]|nr:hypothetical protein BKA83DRAFT_4053833 [Pisolithus microcarpus]